MEQTIKIRHFWLVVACLWTIFIIGLMRIPTVHVPFMQLFQHRYSDEIIHLLLFAVFSGFWTTALGRNRRVGLIVIVLGCLFGLLTEAQQMLLVARTSSFYDFIANCLGVILGTLIALIYQGFKS